jgi:uncharacterized BrkB/YihY/UPF0761 family membrane protein
MKYMHHSNIKKHIMKRSIFRSVLIGILLAVLTFVAFRLVIVLLLVGTIFKLSGKGKWRRQQWKEHKLAYADKIRGMNDADFESFKSNVGTRNGQCY